MPRRTCRKCGVKEGGGVRLQRCGLCKEIKGTDSAYYCSVDCQREDWPEHKEWHEAQEAMVAGACNAGNFDAVAIIARDTVDKASTEYAELVSRSCLHISENDLKQAAKAAKEAIALEPHFPHGYHALAGAYRLAKDPRAGQAYLDASDREEQGTNSWAMCVISAWQESRPESRHFKHFHPCGKPFCDESCCADLPLWLRSAVDMKQMADRVDAVDADYTHSDQWLITRTIVVKQMQAYAHGWLRDWEATGSAWIQAARLIENDPEQKEEFLEYARFAFSQVRR